MKMLSDIEVLDHPDENFWMKTAYRIPATPDANVKPGQTGFPAVPINRMNARSWFTSHLGEVRVPARAPVALRGIALGGDCGVKGVALSTDAGATWQDATLAADEGTYGFRRWSASLPAPAAGGNGSVLLRCMNTKGGTQPLEQNWNGNGFMRNGVERLRLVAA